MHLSATRRRVLSWFNTPWRAWKALPILLLVACPVQAEQVAVGGTWKVRADLADEGLKGHWARPEFDDTQWQRGRTWNSSGYGDPSTDTGGVAWIRTRLDVPARFRGKFLVFEGVAERCSVYLDGMEVARHAPPADPRRHGIARGISPFRIRLPPDRDSVAIALRVESERGSHLGIVRSVLFSDEVLMRVNGYWLPPDAHITHAEWLSALKEKRRQRRAELGADGRIYSGPYAWASRHFVQGFVFIFDTDFYDPVSRRYRIDEYLDEGIRRFGGYDSLLLWHSYPNIGIDAQNQFEMLRNLPGGIEGLSRMIERAHARGVKIFIPYNPWDTMTKQEAVAHEESLAELVARLKVDGVLLDVTRNVPHAALRAALDRKRPGVALQPEDNLGDEGIVTINNSWNQHTPIGAYIDHLRGIPISKWTEPRHLSQADGHRWRHDRTILLQDAFLHGNGVVIWENIFGLWNRLTDRDAAMLRRMVLIQRHFAALTASDAWEPLVPTLLPEVDASHWPGADQALWTFANWSEKAQTGAVLRVPHAPGTHYYDLWNAAEIHPVLDGKHAVLTPRQLEGRGLGAILATRTVPDRALLALLAKVRAEAKTPLAHYSDVWQPPAAPKARIPEKTSRVSASFVPEGMVLIPATHHFRMSIEHNLGEASCYPDDVGAAWTHAAFGINTDASQRAAFMYENGANERNILHDYFVASIPAFFMDQTLVTKREYQRFLEASGYRPTDMANFLKDWDWTDRKRPVPPKGLEDHPVVWVDLEDARAYARWAGKRLPTEPEWQYAAGGTQRRRYPWGESWQPGLANDNSAHTTPVKAFEKGRTPEGLYDMSGNVWQWTESERNDGNRYVILRGGSYYHVGGSPWYFDRFNAFGLSKGETSARPVNTHAKFFLLSASADRKATIGFRTVRDALP